MYHFAVIALLGLVVFKVADLLEDFFPGLTRMHTLVTLGLGVAAAVAMDYSLFSHYEIGVREAWMGTWLTGLIAGSTATVWRVVFGWLGSSEGEAPEKRHHGRPRGVAA